MPEPDIGGGIGTIAETAFGAVGSQIAELLAALNAAGVVEVPPGLDLTDDPELQRTLAAILGSSGSGGSSGGAAPVDPTVTAASSFYFQLWGRKPPTGYIEGFINQGHDLFDFMTFQLARPGADNQQHFRDEFARYSALAAQVFARR